MPTFTISVNNKVLGTYVVKKTVITIGRSRTNTISIASKAVSRTHVRIERVKEGWTVTDLGSLNGTYVNDIRIANAFLSEGDKVVVGAYAISFSPEPSQDASDDELRAASQSDNEGADTDVRVEAFPPATDTALEPPKARPASGPESREISEPARPADGIYHTAGDDAGEAGGERSPHPDTKALQMTGGGVPDVKEIVEQETQGKESLLRSNPAGLQLEDRVRLAVLENPLADENDIRKRLADPDFGGANVGKTDLAAILRTIGLETKIKRYNYFLHS
jgi:pSer/pThr/pTyr-binding forkhead associated (FHA) protein